MNRWWWRFVPWWKRCKCCGEVGPTVDFWPHMGVILCAPCVYAVHETCVCSEPPSEAFDFTRYA